MCGKRTHSDRGDSLVVRIPKTLAEEAGFAQGDRVTLRAAEGEIVLRRADHLPTLQELVAQITPHNRYGETRSGRNRGREVVGW